jgi:hypothetical protein
MTEEVHHLFEMPNARLARPKKATALP